jgi:hypothetical protein
MGFKIFTLIISAFRNNVATLHLHLLHCSGEINNNVLKLLLYLQAVRCRSAATLETRSSVVFSGMYFYSLFLLSNDKLLLAS